MDFTREPIIESIITPREGFRIVVRSSKNVGHEEYFVDALEMVVFGGTVFFRSNEKPKPFLVPSCDYEIFEVREPRVLLKTPLIEGTVKISSFKEQTTREQPVREQPPKPLHRSSSSSSNEQTSFRMNSPVQEEKEEVVVKEEKKLPLTNSEIEAPFSSSTQEESSNGSQDAQYDKKKDKRTRYRKRKGSRDDMPDVKDEKRDDSSLFEDNTLSPKVLEGFSEAEVKVELTRKDDLPPVIRTVLPPPSTLIRDDIERLRKDDTFKGAFFIKDDRTEVTEGDDDDAPVVPKRLVFDEDEAGDTESLDDYKAKPAKSSMKEVREPFWIPPPIPTQSELKKPE